MSYQLEGIWYFVSHRAVVSNVNTASLTLQLFHIFGRSLVLLFPSVCDKDVVTLVLEGEILL